MKIIAVTILGVASTIWLWVIFKIQKLKNDKVWKDIVESERSNFQGIIKNRNILEENHEKKIIEIASGVSDDMASELLSQSPSRSKILSPKSPRNGISRNKKVPSNRK